eukprot:CAMPEP_0182417038 /NCGR_PEP_ID=MMETSP1167-20130531/1468_1 /TAXON_ID=2988 /ORGANISM="Mallomonas Sp, Strain CCMP3275" /LENGTH=169 /DNA_ID=CAMNT_0024590311 /DNA_START=589 /DNA_END=1098 /DNA_ORIENTATION=+
MSGLVLCEDVRWISFHSGYDFGYLMKTLTCQELPSEENAFMDLLHLYFPCIYDVKFMMTAVEGMYGGLNALADTLNIDRIGPMHQAGSDSLLTAQTFFELVRRHLNGSIDDTRFRGQLFGLGSNFTKFKNNHYYQPSSQVGMQSSNGTSNVSNSFQISTGNDDSMQEGY